MASRGDLLVRAISRRPALAWAVPAKANACRAARCSPGSGFYNASACSLGTAFPSNFLRSSGLFERPTAIAQARSARRRAVGSVSSEATLASCNGVTSNCCPTGAAFACEAPEFQQLMLPLIWDPATPADQAQVLAGAVIGLPDSVRLPICLTFLRHRDESIRATGETVLAAYFPNAPESAYPAAVQAYLANPE